MSALRLTEQELASRKVAPPLEKDIQAAVKNALAVHPEVDRVYRVNSGAHVAGHGESRRFIRYHTIEGMTDLLVLLHPRHGTRQGYIEIKRPGEKPSEKQTAFIAMMALRGHIAFWTTSVADAWERFNEALAIEDE